MNEEIKEEKTELVEITKADEELSALIEKHDGRVYDMKTTKGENEAIAVRGQFKAFRIGLGKTSKEMKSNLNEIKRKIDFETARITDKVKLHEGPIDDLIKARQAEKLKAKEAEQERVNDIQNKIHELSGTPDRCNGLGSEKIGDVIAGLNGYDITDFFAEFKDQAHAAVNTAIDRLQDMQCDAAKREKDERDRIEEAHRLAQQKKEQDATEKRQNRFDEIVRMIGPLDDDITAEQVNVVIESVKEKYTGFDFGNMQKTADHVINGGIKLLEELGLRLVAIEAEAEKPADPEPEKVEATETVETPLPATEAEPTAMRESVTEEKPKTLAELRKRSAPVQDRGAWVPASQVKEFETELLKLARDYWVPRMPTAEEFAAWINSHMVDQLGGSE